MPLDGRWRDGPGPSPNARPACAVHGAGVRLHRLSASLVSGGTRGTSWRYALQLLPGGHPGIGRRPELTDGKGV